ncbi:MAG: hypothetical protein GJ671_00680 [Alteromonadaceae bacterium]|nr:hypothetical protein [Alteromonadaceae bacterium]
MNLPLKKFLPGFVLVIIASVSSAQEFALAHIEPPEHYNIVLENEHVLMLKPGESDSAHRHHNETVCFQKGDQLTIT